MGFQHLDEGQKIAVLQSSLDQQNSIMVDMAKDLGGEEIMVILNVLQDKDEWEVAGLNHDQSCLLCWAGLVNLKRIVIEATEESMEDEL